MISEDGHCMLADFGFATRRRAQMRKVCGTAEYIPPEVLMQQSYAPEYVSFCFTNGSLRGYQFVLFRNLNGVNLFTSQSMIQVCTRVLISEVCVHTCTLSYT